MKLEFLLCGSPNDAFWSQAAIFRQSLDSLGKIYQKARLVFCYGAAEPMKLPERWQPYFTNIEVHPAPHDRFSHGAYGAQADHLYSLLHEDADFAFICDADTLLLRPLPQDFLDELQVSPAICGVIAHYPPSTTHSGTPVLPETMSADGFWRAVSEYVLGRSIPSPHSYSLMRDPECCPFYINHGFVAGTPALLKRLYQQLRVLQPRIRLILDNDYCAQIGIALGVEGGNLPTRVLPMRFNFPNDPIADDLHAEELPNVVLMHYLRTTSFDRHQIFVDPIRFEEFIRASLTGSNKIFQNYIIALTNGEYPFLIIPA